MGPGEVKNRFLGKEYLLRKKFSYPATITKRERQQGRVTVGSP